MYGEDAATGGKLLRPPAPVMLCAHAHDCTTQGNKNSLQSSRHRANFRYFSRTRAPSILLMNKLIRPVVQCGPTSLPRSSQHRRFGSLVFTQVQALDFGLFHSVELSHVLYVVVMVQPGTWGTTFLFSRWCHFQLPARILVKTLVTYRNKPALYIAIINFGVPCLVQEI